MTKKSAEQKKFDLFVKYQKVFDCPEGEEVLKDLLKTFHYFNTTLSDSPYETHFKEGQRSVVTRIIQTLKVDPEQMMKLVGLDNQQGEHNALD